MTLTEEQRGTVGFDLEKARAALEEAIDRMSLAVRDEDGDVWEADPEQAEILQAILDRTEIAENHRCLELQYQLDSAESEIERLRAALAESEKVVEHKGKSATHWYDEHLRAQTDLTQSKRVIDQQAARIKSLKKEIRRLKHESKVEQEFTNSYIKRLHDAEARIKELEAQCEDLMQNCNSLRERAWKAEVRIKEQDDALVEERTGAIRCESYDHCEGMYRIDLPDAMIRAQQELQAEGKIGPDAETGNRDHVVGPDQMIPSWQITEERKAAIWHAVAVLKENDPDDEHLWDEEIAVLRAMLREAE